MDGRVLPNQSTSRARPRETWKAGPLNGIWATAPFLHNGSVPTLADLPLPVDRRPTRLDVGSRRLDVLEVGFEAAAGTGTTFDTGIDGNRNGGHGDPECGTTLSEGTRRDLLEFLKTL